MKLRKDSPITDRFALSAWNNSPYDLPGVCKVSNPYKPFHQQKLRKNNNVNARSLSESILDTVAFPYQSPLPISNPVKPFEAPLGPLPSNACTSGNEPSSTAAKAVECESRAFLKDYVARNYSDRRKACQTQSGGRSPIPLSASTSPRHTTPTRASTTFDSSPSSTKTESKTIILSRTQISNADSPLSQREKNIPQSPVFQGTSSPDPLMIRPFQKYARVSVALGKQPSSPVVRVVVEVPALSPRKSASRLAAFDTPPRKKRALATLSSTAPQSAKISKHGPFSDWTSEADDRPENDATSEMDTENITAGMPKSEEKGKSRQQENRKGPLPLPLRTAMQTGAQSPSKAMSSSTTDQVLLEKLMDLVQRILEAEYSLISDTSMDIDGESGHDAAKAYFQASGSDGRNGLLQPGVIREFAKTINTLIRSKGGRRKLVQAMSRVLENDTYQKGKQHEKEESDFVGQLVSILKMLERTVSSAEMLEVIPKGLCGTENGRRDDITSLKKTPQKQTAQKRIGLKNSMSPFASSSAIKPRRSSRSATPSESYTEDIDEEGEEEEEEDRRGSSEERDSDEQSSGQSSPIKAFKTFPSKRRKPVAAPAAPRGRKKPKTAQSNRQSQSQWTEDSLDEFDQNLSILNEAVLAIDACMSLLTAGRLPKKVWVIPVIHKKADGLLRKCSFTRRI